MIHNRFGVSPKNGIIRPLKRFFYLMPLLVEKTPTTAKNTYIKNPFKSKWIFKI
jgi:hypothetical protein